MAATAAPMPTGDIPGPWHLIFDDEFNGSSLNETMWTPAFFGNDSTVTGPINVLDECVYYSPQVSVADSVMTLTMITETNTSSKGTFDYTSGLVCTLANAYPWTTPPCFAASYGFFEARIWLADTTGVIDNWPSFWLHGYSSDESAGEIDIMEGIGGIAKAHYNNANGAYGPLTGSGGTYAGGWHTFACDWEPGFVNFYYDGVLIGGFTSAGIGAPGIIGSLEYMILNLGSSSTLSPPIVSPSVMMVDYVRVWQH
jgi:beta-glucanase (GH16 family)